MNKLILAVSPLILCVATSAQTYLTSPQGYLSTIGESVSWFFGTGMEHRHQTMDGNFRNSLMTLKEISYRHDEQTGLRPQQGMGRSWKNVTLHMARCDFDKTMASGASSAVFSLTATLTPTLVFSGPVTWPTIAGGGNPTAPWGGVSGEYSFPFGTGGTSTLWIHSGTQDFMYDYRFQGGSFANGYTRNQSAYYMDAAWNNSYSGGKLTYHGPADFSGGCTDSASTSTLGAFNNMYAFVYGPDYSTTSYRNRFRLYTYSWYTGPNSTAVHALGLSGSAAGFAVPGVTCQKLFVNPSSIFHVWYAKTDASGGSGMTFPFNPGNGTPSDRYSLAGTFPIVESAFGLELWNQCAWSDTRTGALKLTRAIQVKVPRPSHYQKNASIFQPDAKQIPQTAIYPMSQLDRYSPLPRYLR